MTFPAASVPLCPSMSTTRVEAMLSARRNSVASSSTVGKTENSSGRGAYTVIRMTTSASAMLKVKNMSRARGGSGRTIITRSATSKIGVPSPVRTNFPSACINLLILRFSCRAGGG